MRLYKAPSGEFTQKLASELSKIEQIKAPEWAAYSKTGMQNERPPSQDNWWSIRAASILRKVAIKGPIGTQKLRRHYGGRKNRGHKKDKFFIAGGNHIRTILQQLEAAELVKQEEVHNHKGRVVTPRGQSLLDKTANQVISK